MVSKHSKITSLPSQKSHAHVIKDYPCSYKFMGKYGVPCHVVALGHRKGQGQTAQRVRGWNKCKMFMASCHSVAVCQGC